MGILKFGEKIVKFDNISVYNVSVKPFKMCNLALGAQTFTYSLYLSIKSIKILVWTLDFVHYWKQI